MEGVVTKKRLLDSPPPYEPPPDYSSLVITDQKESVLYSAKDIIDTIPSTKVENTSPKTVSKDTNLKANISMVSSATTEDTSKMTMMDNSSVSIPTFATKNILLPGENSSICSASNASIPARGSPLASVSALDPTVNTFYSSTTLPTSADSSPLQYVSTDGRKGFSGDHDDYSSIGIRHVPYLEDTYSSISSSKQNKLRLNSYYVYDEKNNLEQICSNCNCPESIGIIWSPSEVQSPSNHSTIPDSSKNMSTSLQFTQPITLPLQESSGTSKVNRIYKNDRKRRPSTTNDKLHDILSNKSNHRLKFNLKKFSKNPSNTSLNIVESSGKSKRKNKIVIRAHNVESEISPLKRNDKSVLTSGEMFSAVSTIPEISGFFQSKKMYDVDSLEYTKKPYKYLETSISVPPTSISVTNNEKIQVTVDV